MKHIRDIDWDDVLLGIFVGLLIGAVLFSGIAKGIDTPAKIGVPAPAVSHATLDRRDRMDMPALLRAIEQVETSGRGAVIGDNGRAYGVLQIHQSALSDCNRQFGTSYTLADIHRSRALSRWVFIHYTRRWGATTYEDAARIWNGGPRGMGKAAALGYWRKVEAALNNHGAVAKW